MANGMDTRDKKARWRQQERSKSPKPTTTLDQQSVDDSDADTYYTAASDFEEDEEPGLIKTDRDEMDGLQAELSRYKQQISALDERLEEIGKKKQRLEQDVLRLRVHQSMKKNRKRVANQNTTVERQQNSSFSNSPSQATTTAIPNPIKAKQDRQHIIASPISTTNHTAIQQPMTRPSAASAVSSSASISVPAYKMQKPTIKPVIPAKPVNNFTSHHRQWVAPYAVSPSSQSAGNNSRIMTIPPTSQPTRSSAVITPKGRTPITTPNATSSPSAGATVTPKVTSSEMASSAVKEAWQVESIPRTYAPPLRGPKEPRKVKEAPAHVVRNIEMKHLADRTLIYSFD